MKMLDSVTIGGYKPLRSLALLACSVVVATVTALYIYIDASGSTLVTFKDYGYAYFLVATTCFTLMCAAFVARPPSEEEVRAAPYIFVAGALAVSALSGYMAGRLYFGIPITSEDAYITRDGTIHRGEELRHKDRMHHDGYVVIGRGTPRVVTIARGHVSLLGFRFRYVVSDGHLQRTDVDFNALAEKAAREIYGSIARETSRTKRLAALAEIHKHPFRRDRDWLLELFCTKLDAPCPFAAVYWDYERTPDVPENLWSDRYTVREALDEENVKVAIALLRSKDGQQAKDSIFDLVLKKGTEDAIVATLEHVALEHPLHDALVERLLAMELSGGTLILLGTGQTLKKREHRLRARARMIEDVRPADIPTDRRYRIRMSVEEANAYGEKLLGGRFTDDDRARFMALYHDQLMNALSHRLADTVTAANAESLIGLLSAQFLDETLRDKAVDAIARAQDSAIVQALLNRRSNYRDADRLLTKPEVNRIVAGFLENANDPKWFAALTNYADAHAITSAQAQALAKRGLGLKNPDVFRVALEPSWSSAEEATAIMREFLGFADKYDCVRVLRMDASSGRGRRTNRLPQDIRDALQACAGDQLSHLKRRH